MDVVVTGRDGGHDEGYRLGLLVLKVVADDGVQPIKGPLFVADCIAAANRGARRVDELAL